ncbi:mitogen-activated protein kinase kinase kinase 17-like [Camellia sinensis]|uniref:mitogen-activated protein kinase kinase kinase 17-like n=1 Tax=Camellia sinensis TaxID=4442 RepID=UPI001035AA8E|nr:mitogen-activated protein kinase kinase kinase 17-like [Camellia sinensis]
MDNPSLPRSPMKSYRGAAALGGGAAGYTLFVDKTTNRVPVMYLQLLEDLNLVHSTHPNLSYTENQPQAYRCIPRTQSSSSVVVVKSLREELDRLEAHEIADLGCARLAKHGGNTVFSGTSVFMAPEVVSGEEQGFPADSWALGCTVIEMATGSPPWPEVNDPVSALYRIGFSGDVPEFPRWFSKPAKDFLSKCLKRGCSTVNYGFSCMRNELHWKWERYV